MRGIYIFWFWKKFILLFFQPFRCLIQIFFQNSAKVFSGALSKLHSLCPQKKIFPGTDSSWRNFRSFLIVLGFLTRIRSEFWSQIWAGLQNCFFLSKENLWNLFFKNFERNSIIFLSFFPVSDPNFSWVVAIIFPAELTKLHQMCPQEQFVGKICLKKFYLHLLPCLGFRERTFGDFARNSQ